MRARYTIVRHAPACSVLSAFSLSARQSSSTFIGAVTDASGAVVPNAVIFIRNTENSAVRTAVTHGSGIYVVSNVSPGTYAVSIQKKGFESIGKTGAMLGVNQTLGVSFQLMIGNESINVTVQAAPAQIEASIAELGSVVAEKDYAWPGLLPGPAVEPRH